MYKRNVPALYGQLVVLLCDVQQAALARVGNDACVAVCALENGVLPYTSWGLESNNKLAVHGSVVPGTGSWVS